MTKAAVAAADERGPDPGTDVAQALIAPGKQTPAMADHTEGMAYLDTLPKRIVTTYIPLILIMVVLLFPFYWMVLTAIKPDEQLLDLEKYNPFFVTAPTFKHIYKLLFETAYPLWLWNTMFIAIAATLLSLF